MKEMTSNVPPGFNEDGFPLGMVSNGYRMVRISPRPMASETREKIKSLQEGVDRFNNQKLNQ